MFQYKKYLFILSYINSLTIAVDLGYTPPDENYISQLRFEGFCLKLCGLGSDFEKDGFNTIMKTYKRFKATGEYEKLIEQLYDADEDEEEEDINKYPTTSTEFKIDRFCNDNKLNFEDCIELAKSHIRMEEGERCYEHCCSKRIRIKYAPSFDEMAPIFQELEKCYTEFHGPDEHFDIASQSFTTDNLLAELEKFGFVIIENMFPKRMTNKINTALKTWNETGIWRALAISNYSNSDHLRNEINRTEIVLPNVEPFTTLLAEIHTSKIMRLMNQYAKTENVHLEFASALVSYPYAPTQEIYHDIRYGKSMITVIVVPQDIIASNGPISVCPCTHLNGAIYDFYHSHRECPVRYKPQLLKAGTVIVYDASMQQHSSRNFRNVTTTLLRFSYSIGHTFSENETPFPDPAIKEILSYRKNYQYL